MKHHLAKVAEIGCIVCRNVNLGQTPAEIHHLRTGYGRGQRAPHTETIPLCSTHHRLGDGSTKFKGHLAFHFNRKMFEERYGREVDLLKQVMEIIYGND